MLNPSVWLLLLGLTLRRSSAQESSDDPLRLPEEKHLKNIRWDGDKNIFRYISCQPFKWSIATSHYIGYLFIYLRVKSSGDILRAGRI